MYSNHLEQLKLPEGLNIEQNYDALVDQERQEHGYICYRMSNLGDIIGYSNYKREDDHWYIDEFDTQLPNSVPGKGYGTYFLKYLVREMYQQDEIIIHTVAADTKNPNFPQWLINRGFKQDNLFFPHKINSRILHPSNFHYLWNKYRVP